MYTMKFLKFAWTRNDPSLVKIIILVFSSFFLYLLITDNIFVNPSKFSSFNGRKKLCFYLQDKLSPFKNFLSCETSLNDVTSKDWKSLKSLKSPNTVRIGKDNQSEEHTNGNRKKKRKKNVNEEIKDENKEKEIWKINKKNIYRKNNGNNNFTIQKRNGDEILFLDTNNPSFNEHVLQKSKIVYKKLDMNNNGYIDFNEFKTNIEILTDTDADQISPNILNYLYTLFDEDRDEKLNLPEFMFLNSYNFTYVKIAHIVFNNKDFVNKNTVYEYVCLYFLELLENIIEKENHTYNQKNTLAHLFTKSFLRNEWIEWDINANGKLEINEFHNFQISLLVNVDYLTNFLQIDYNLNGEIDISEILFYLNNDVQMFHKLNKFMKNTKNKEDIFNFIKKSLLGESFNHIYELVLFIFETTNGMFLDFDDYKNHIATFLILNKAPEIIFEM